MMTKTKNRDDEMALLDVREMLRAAIQQQLLEVEITGSGFGMGQADIDIEWKGRAYYIRIKPAPELD